MSTEIRKGNLAIDPRGLIYESFRIENVTIEECRTIFLDWAMSAPDGDMTEQLHALLAEYQPSNVDHPMCQVIEQGLTAAAKPKRRGGRLRKRG